MNKYTYWENQFGRKKILEIIAETSLIADEAFEKTFGFNPNKNSYISYTASFDIDYKVGGPTYWDQFVKGTSNPSLSDEY